MMPVPHPCFVDPNPYSTLKPHTTATVKCFRVSKVPAHYPYTTIPVVKVYPKQGLDTFQQVNVPFFEFRGHARPPIDVGNPGDAYIDLNPASHALYSRTETQWVRWPGPIPNGVNSHDYIVGHSDFVERDRERYLWCDVPEGVRWCSLSTAVTRSKPLYANGVKDLDVGAVLIQQRQSASRSSLMPLARLVL
ncbi:hypothetical protein B0H10DRAFT_534268 [Mycena sp. CBHHK59/15]|nr:hypothetical protein B0H10DRAFT_534268 [Mycena sp. CBHHK59/15]